MTLGIRHRRGYCVEACAIRRLRRAAGVNHDRGDGEQRNVGVISQRIACAILQGRGIASKRQGDEIDGIHRVIVGIAIHRAECLADEILVGKSRKSDKLVNDIIACLIQLHAGQTGYIGLWRTENRSQAFLGCLEQYQAGNRGDVDTVAAIIGQRSEQNGVLLIAGDAPRRIGADNEGRGVTGGVGDA